ncbi:LURP1-like domain [Macleaya cordata]|uniref:LURP1-like domain n=1 Tax=Macleaya cordata TaxID=56857 RepID=A0A200QQE0_MACCD|nr:LURP1-like domain [Macleaya cordata]
MTHNKRWKVYKGDSSSKDYLLFTARQPSSIKDFPTKLLDVFLATNAKEKEKNACSDVTVIGSWVERSCTFYACTTKYSNSPAIIAQMSKKQKVIGSEQMLGDEEEYRKDMSTVTVYPKIDYAFIVALIVILDTIHDDDKSLGKKESRADAMNFATSAVSLADATLSVVANIFPAN